MRLKKKFVNALNDRLNCPFKILRYVYLWVIFLIVYTLITFTGLMTPLAFLRGMNPKLCSKRREISGTVLPHLFQITPFSRGIYHRPDIDAVLQDLGPTANLVMASGIPDCFQL